MQLLKDPSSAGHRTERRTTVAPRLRLRPRHRHQTLTPPEPAVPAADELPIEEHESLAASHVVARLGDLDPSELREVRRFELAHRGRRTVLDRIDQLLGAAAPT